MKTDSEDHNGLILLNGGEMIAVLVELTDESHGDERGKWSIETLFGLGSGAPDTFATAGDAADWVSGQAGSTPFLLGSEIEWLQ